MTAVEWLTDKFYANEGIIKSEWLEKAKVMEKEQIINAINLDKRNYDNAEEYYKKTYKSE